MAKFKLLKARKPINPSEHQPASWLPEMNTCPKCGSSRLTATEGCLCTVECKDCGFSTSGTASFSSTVEVEQDFDLVFRLSSPKQIPVVRAIVPELSNRSTAELLHSFRNEGSTITISSLTMWRVRSYAEKAAAKGIQVIVVPKMQNL